MTQRPALVDRPTLTERPKHHAMQHDYDLLLSTADNGKAVKIPLGNRTINGVRSSLAQYVRERGYRLRAHDPKDGTIIAWVENREL